MRDGHGWMILGGSLGEIPNGLEVPHLEKQHNVPGAQRNHNTTPHKSLSRNVRAFALLNASRDPYAWFSKSPTKRKIEKGSPRAIHASKFYSLTKLVFWCRICSLDCSGSRKLCSNMTSPTLTSLPILISKVYYIQLVCRNFAFSWSLFTSWNFSLMRGKVPTYLEDLQ